MTREEEVREFITERFKTQDEGVMSMIRESAVLGMMWADEHPQNPWVSVDERLPEITNPSLGESDFVFVHAVNKDTGAEWIELPAKYNERFHDWQTNDFTWIRKRSGVVTHWMPIPSVEGGEVC